MTLDDIRDAVEMTTQPELSLLLEQLIEHRGITISTVLLDLPRLMVERFADHLVRLGYILRTQGKEKCYFATIAGHEIHAVMRRGTL